MKPLATSHSPLANDKTEQESAAGSSVAAEVQSGLEKLEGALQRQREHLLAGDLEGASGLMPGVDELLAHMADCMARCKAHGISLAALDPQRVERVEELYRQLVMSVLASKQECAEQMAQMGRGRAMLRAYSFSPESGKR